MTDRTDEQQKVLDDFVGLDWEEIRKDLDRAEWFDGGGGSLERSVYLGRTWDLVPKEENFEAGEAEPVRILADTGPGCALDFLWWDLVREKAEELCISVACGDGDGCDIYATESGDDLTECVVMQHTDSTACYGGRRIGSAEAEGGSQLEERVILWMQQQEFYPLTFWLSDHGNLHQITLNTDEPRDECEDCQLVAHRSLLLAVTKGTPEEGTPLCEVCLEVREAKHCESPGDVY